MNGRRNFLEAETKDGPVAGKEALVYLTDIARAPDAPEAIRAMDRAIVALGDEADVYQPMLDVVFQRVMEAHRLRELAGTDEMTGVSNRRAFNDALDREIARHQRNAGGLAVLLLDLDDLKLLNDKFGHAVGDEAIVMLARVCQDLLRQTDLVARLGGDEFAILLPGADEWVAIAIARRLRMAVEERTVQGRNLRVSIGAAVSRRGPTDREALLARADAELYADKQARKRNTSLHAAA
jgi:diguanylate cyclase (GGDEF)-like protein